MTDPLPPDLSVKRIEELIAQCRNAFDLPQVRLSELSALLSIAHSAAKNSGADALAKVMDIFWEQDAESEARHYYCGRCEAEGGAERAIWQEVPHRDDCPYAIALSALKEGETDGAEKNG